MYEEDNISKCMFGNPTKIDSKVKINPGEAYVSSFWASELIQRKKKLIQTCYEASFSLAINPYKAQLYLDPHRLRFWIQAMSRVLLHLHSSVKRTSAGISCSVQLLPGLSFLSLNLHCCTF